LKASITPKIISGYNNDNYIINVSGEDIILRIPNSRKNDTDICLHHEGELLTALQNKLDMIPQVIYYDNTQHLLIEKYIYGKTLETIYPVESTIPDEMVINVAKIIKKVHSIDCSKIIVNAYQNSRGTVDFYNAIKNNISNTCNKYLQFRSSIYENLGIYLSDIDIFFSESKRITNRKLKLCHCDIHKKNIIVDYNKKIWLIDWELSMLGDPLYDLAVHFQKMRYSERTIYRFLNEYFLEKDSLDISSFYQEIKIYQEMEAIKYVIVDLMHLIQSYSTEYMHKNLIKKYCYKLNKAYQVLKKQVEVTEGFLENIIENYSEEIKNEIIHN
jgi:putative aminoglycoside phosphotransferase